MVCTSLLTAQEKGELIPSDTSYFRTGEDDWNLIESVIRGHAAETLMLLKRGADPDAKAEGGMTALMYAAEQGDTLLVKILVLNGANPELTYVERTTPLLVAVLNHRFDAAHYLLKKGANPDHRDIYQVTPLLYAAAMNDYRMADLLLFFGASDTIRDRDGNDAVMTAVYDGNLETTDVLLQNGLSPDTPDKHGNTPLMIAAQQGNREMISLLLEYGAGLEKCNKKNHTALSQAVLFRQDSVAMILVDSGANIHHAIRPNRNIYDLAVQQDQQALVQFLKEKGATPTPRPDFSEVDLIWGNSFCSTEYMMQVRMSMVDVKFDWFLETGVDFRPSYRKVQVEQNDQLIYQYREYRWAWSHGAGKNFTIARERSGTEYGIYAGLYGLLSISRYRGFGERPPVHYSLAPSGGFYLKGEMAGLRIGGERYTFGTRYEKPWKMNITLFIRIVTQRSDHVYKEIRYD